MWYVRELTKLCAYGFQFMFQVLPVRKGRARDDHIARTMIFRLFDSDVLLGYFINILWFFQTCWVDGYLI